MRLWSISPKYLDTKGLVALWREALLAKHVLEGKTKGYKNHPQLNRFKNHPFSIEAINFYLSHVFIEASKRGYKFNISKFELFDNVMQLPVTTGQINYEFQHLLKKLQKRDLNKHIEIFTTEKIELLPMFYETEGEIEEWEITY
jgi:hypothetical protein